MLFGAVKLYGNFRMKSFSSHCFFLLPLVKLCECFFIYMVQAQLYVKWLNFTNR